MTTRTLRQFCQQLPKTELHAHLLGSVSEQTVTKLMGRCHLGGQNMTLFEKGRSRTLDECFEAFKMIHKLTEDEESLNMVTRDVIKEFSQDGVKYLELRSTPREEEHTGMTRRSYVEAVLNAIRSPEISALDITVRLLLSIDRKNGAMVAMETVKLAQEYLLMSDECVVGVDLSGNPKVGHWREFYPALQVARSTGLKLSLHLAEIPGQEEETQALLQLQPHRIGHGTFLKTTRDDTSELVEHVRNLNIPLELCLTSNVNSQTVNTYTEHHFKFWFDQGHPCTFCTDDKGVFNTTLSEEYEIAATTFGLSLKQLWDISYNSIDFAFAQQDVKDKLRLNWDEHKHLILGK